ncbi:MULTISPECIES: YqjK-like family protein [Halomonas]|uniref:YqjK-like family protein n=1 Tax=Halomonas TaxID=2745 RepID=UPI001C93C009|nr:MULTISPECIES: YqjK-like family protein [Halomonas]MBY6207933.1 YqjK-like family protein [Halomonas sp. DP3Y7-2]MBY6228742.1 YqjK-like family protein [Halomonas sp. DP3Y7-1]MCA0917274.1 YqjK-like family protein [Halomonas denitrificans]
MNRDQPSATRAQRKAALEATIEQQRLDILLAAHRYQQAGRRIDAGWQAVSRYRTPVLLGAGAALIPVLRHPGRLTRWGRKLVVTALAVQRVRRLIQR